MELGLIKSLLFGVRVRFYGLIDLVGVFFNIIFEILVIFIRRELQNPSFLPVTMKSWNEELNRDEELFKLFSDDYSLMSDHICPLLG